MKLIKHLFYFSLIGLTVFACKEDETGTENNNPETSLSDLRKRINMNTATNIIIPAYQDLELKLIGLDDAVSNFVESPGVSGLEEARTALKEAWLSWQSAAIYNFGPSENVALRKSLNIYPTNTDQIEANVSNGDYILGSIANQAAIGFPAIDYLLNGLSTDAASIVALFESKAGRGVYLKALSGDMLQRAESTLNAWETMGGNYATTYANANGTDIGSSLGLLINAIDLHYQRFLRDGKIAIPAGIRSAGVPRPKTTEAFYGGYSVELLVNGLRAYLNLFEGIGSDDIDREGIFDYLELLGETALAGEVETQFNAAIVAAQSLSDPLPEQIESDLDKVVGVFLELQKVVPLLKADVASKMGIIITNTDNDGD